MGKTVTSYYPLSAMSILYCVIGHIQNLRNTLACVKMHCLVCFVRVFLCVSVWQSEVLRNEPRASCMLNTHSFKLFCFKYSLLRSNYEIVANVPKLSC
jgi:hypothetical protein